MSNTFNFLYQIALNNNIIQRFVVFFSYRRVLKDRWQRKILRWASVMKQDFADCHLLRWRITWQQLFKNYSTTTAYSLPFRFGCLFKCCIFFFFFVHLCNWFLYKSMQIINWCYIPFILLWLSFGILLPDCNSELQWQMWDLNCSICKRKRTFDRQQICRLFCLVTVLSMLMGSFPEALFMYIFQHKSVGIKQKTCYFIPKRWTKSERL